jgi:hypothetical protein
MTATTTAQPRPFQSNRGALAALTAWTALAVRDMSCGVVVEALGEQGSVGAEGFVQ